MASWSELQAQFPEKIKQNPNWLHQKLTGELGKISKLRNDRVVIFYASAFLQKKQENIETLILREDINGFMNAIYEAEVSNGLTLILHTPGGDPHAVESIVDYLHAKFNYIEVIVPYLAMSGGAIISLASNLVILGKQSQLGPIDPQFSIGGKIHSARAIQEGFGRAKKDILEDIKLGHLWAPILQSMGPSLVVEAERTLKYSEELVEKWLNERMFIDISDEDERKEKAKNIAKYFNAEDTEEDGKIHVHGQRIGFQKLEELEAKVELLENTQELQTAVLTAYHLMTLIFENGPYLKFIASNKDKTWSKQEPLLIQQPLPPR